MSAVSSSGAAEPVERGQSGVQSIQRAFDLLELIAATNDGAGLSKLVTESGLSVATVHRLLKTLEQDGYVRRGRNRVYSLGSRLIYLGVTASELLGDWGRPYLAQLVERTGETANLAVLDADEVVYVGQVQSQRRLQMFINPGNRLPAHCTAVGKVLLANLDTNHVKGTLVRTGMTRRTDRTITDPTRFLKELEGVRKRGYAFDDGEQEEGVRCFAVSVPNAPRNIAVSVSGPKSRFVRSRAGELVGILTEVSEQLSTELNARGLPRAD